MLEKLQHHIEKTISLTDLEFNSIASKFKYETYNKGDLLVEADTKVSKVYWVIDGLVKAYFLDNQGAEKILQFALEDWWITDYDAFFNQKKGNLFIECIEPVKVLSLTYKDRETLCDQNHQMANFFRKKANASMISLQKRVIGHLSHSTKQRYEEIISKYPSFHHRLPKSLLALYLGVSRETLSRLKK